MSASGHYRCVIAGMSFDRFAELIYTFYWSTYFNRADLIGKVGAEADKLKTDRLKINVIGDDGKKNNIFESFRKSALKDKKGFLKSLEECQTNKELVGLAMKHYGVAWKDVEGNLELSCFSPLHVSFDDVSPLMREIVMFLSFNNHRIMCSIDYTKCVDGLGDD